MTDHSHRWLHKNRHELIAEVLRVHQELDETSDKLREAEGRVDDATTDARVQRECAAVAFEDLAALRAGQGVPECIDDGVHLSNKACRLCYVSHGGTNHKPSRAGNCACPDGLCWYREQKTRRDQGLKAVTHKSWLAAVAPHHPSLLPQPTQEPAPAVVVAEGGDVEVLRRWADSVEEKPSLMQTGLALARAHIYPASEVIRGAGLEAVRELRAAADEVAWVTTADMGRLRNAIEAIDAELPELAGEGL